jgi:hypothetical protein
MVTMVTKEELVSQYKSLGLSPEKFVGLVRGLGVKVRVDLDKLADELQLVDGLLARSDLDQVVQALASLPEGEARKRYGFTAFLVKRGASKSNVTVAEALKGASFATQLALARGAKELAL